MPNDATKPSTTTEHRLDAGDLRAFLARDWASLRTRKDEHWLEVARRRGGEATLAAAESLREHVERHAGGDVEERRREDLEALIELKRRIDAASAQFRR